MSEIPRYYLTHDDVAVECVVIQDGSKTTVIPIDPLVVLSGESFTITGEHETVLE